jgi:hypothetical protein
MVTFSCKTDLKTDFLQNGTVRSKVKKLVRSITEACKIKDTEADKVNGSELVRLAYVRLIRYLTLIRCNGGKVMPSTLV